MTTLLAVLSFGMFLLVGVTVVATSVMAHTLKNRFPSVWLAEGQPDRWLWLQPMPATGHIFGFLDERRYEATGDRSFIRFCASIRAAWYASLALAAVALVLAFVWAIQAQP